jgi:hypothetical protein
MFSATTGDGVTVAVLEHSGVVADGGSTRGHEPLERRGQRRQVGELRGSRDLARLAEPVDPHARQPERYGGLDVVEQRGGNVDVAGAVGAGPP